MRTPRSPRRRLRTATVRATVAAGLTALLSTAATSATQAPAAARTDCVPTWTMLDAPAGEGVVDVDVISRDDVRFSEQLEEGARSLRWNGRELVENGPQIPVPARTGNLFQVGAGSFTAGGGWSLVSLHGSFQPDGTGVLARLDRDRWTLTPAGASQSPEAGPAWLSDVATVKSSQAWAVGRVDGPAGGALIQRWDGTEWTSVDHPAARRAAAALTSVKAVPGGGVWAAGFQKNEQTGAYQPMVLRHDGTAWADVALPDPGAEGMLYALDASGPDDVWVAGISGSQSSPRPLLLHWDGQSWTTVPAPQPGPYGGDIFKLYAPPPPRPAVGPHQRQQHGRLPRAALGRRLLAGGQAPGRAAGGVRLHLPRRGRQRPRRRVGDRHLHPHRTLRHRLPAAAAAPPDRPPELREKVT
ncbi:hypothetical protein [Nonomuraea salmonea]|uniref:hypothetical protein n=1 Tax=Nonomuraea salmonea TaxID=46181 RepID=UPI002FE8D51B